MSEEQEQMIILAFADFFKEIDRLEAEHGKASVIGALKALVPDLDDLEVEGVDDVDTSELFKEGMINERAKALVDLVKKGRDLVVKGGKATGTAAAAAAGGLTRIVGGVGGAAVGLAGKAIGKEVDQDVNIADISTNKTLSVGGPLLQQTNDLLKKLTSALAQTQGTLSNQLDDLDLSVDTAAAAGTGLSPAQIDAAQESGVNISSLMKKKKKTKEPKPEPKKK